jgi:hypothetical protein
MNIEKFCQNCKLGTVINITKLTGGLMHKMFKVETDKGIYAIKVLNKEVMARSDAYNNFVISETISNLAKENNIPVSNALNIDGKFIINYEDNYYMIFDFIDGKVLKDDEIIRLLQAAIKLYFKPTDEEVVKISKQLDPTNSSIWLSSIQNLKKGQCIVVGERLKADGTFGSTKPTVTSVTPFNNRK